MRTQIKIEEKIIESYDRKHFDYLLTKDQILIIEKIKSKERENDEK